MVMKMQKFHELIKEIKSSPDFYNIVYDLSEMLDEKMMLIKALNEDLYNDIMICFYTEIHGEHFDESLAKRAVSQMQNADDSVGEHWSHEQTTSAAKSYGIKFDDYNSWDWYYVMNMLYSDMSMLLGKDTTSYVKAAEAWLDDKDVAPGKAFRYYTKVVM